MFRIMMSEQDAHHVIVPKNFAINRATTMWQHMHGGTRGEATQQHTALRLANARWHMQAALCLRSGKKASGVCQYARARPELHQAHSKCSLKIQSEVQKPWHAGEPCRISTKGIAGVRIGL